MPGGMHGGMNMGGGMGMGGMSNNNFQQPQQQQYGGMHLQQRPQYSNMPQQYNMGMNNNTFQQGGFQQQSQPQQNSNTNAGFFWMDFCQQCIQK